MRALLRRSETCAVRRRQIPAVPQLAAGALPVLVARLRSADEAVVQHAATALDIIVLSDDAQRAAVTAAGAIEAAQEALARCLREEAWRVASDLLDHLLPPLPEEAAPAVAPTPSLSAVPRVCAAPGCGAT